MLEDGVCVIESSTVRLEPCDGREELGVGVGVLVARQTWRESRMS
jgi:hypothetical protein